MVNILGQPLFNGQYSMTKMHTHKHTNYNERNCHAYLDAKTQTVSNFEPTSARRTSKINNHGIKRHKTLYRQACTNAVEV